MNGRTDQDCRIEAVSASCGCARVADAPKLIPKNESVSIPITFDVTTEGEKRVDVVAVLDDGTTRHITLVARGVVDIAGRAPLARPTRRWRVFSDADDRRTTDDRRATGRT